jgi:hypothetical protein
MSLYLEISTCNYMVYLHLFFCSVDVSLYLHLFSSFITQSLILPVTLFLSANILWWFTLKRYLCYTLYIVKAKENSREFVWQRIMVDGEWCSEWG